MLTRNNAIAVTLAAKCSVTVRTRSHHTRARACDRKHAHHERQWRRRSRSTRNSHTNSPSRVASLCCSARHARMHASSPTYPMHLGPRRSRCQCTCIPTSAPPQSTNRLDHAPSSQHRCRHNIDDTTFTTTNVQQHVVSRRLQQAQHRLHTLHKTMITWLPTTGTKHSARLQVSCTAVRQAPETSPRSPLLPAPTTSTCSQRLMMSVHAPLRASVDARIACARTRLL
jgi:hypothetical protein